MILPGAKILSQSLLRNLLSPTHQLQPCSVDLTLTLTKISQYTTPATLSLTNTHRRAAKLIPFPFLSSTSSPAKKSPTKTSPTPTSPTPSLHLPPGTYHLTFNESITVPLTHLARLHSRSSLWRSGVTIHAGIIDAGYRGALGAMLDVRNPHGVVLCEGARVAQVVFEAMEGDVGEGYGGVYQGVEDSGGRDGDGDGQV